MNQCVPKVIKSARGRRVSNHRSDNKSLIGTNISDLSDDCLEVIFGYLDLRSLFSVAVSKECLRVAARSVFSRKFRATTVNIYIVAVPCDSHDYALDDFTPVVCWITINDLKLCLQFLRCFGSAITKLEITYSQSIFEFVAVPTTVTLV